MFGAGILVLAIVLIFLASGMRIFLALTLAGMLSFLALTHYGNPGAMVASVFWNANNNFALTSLPLFILMGELLLRSKIGERLYTGLGPWLEHLPDSQLITEAVTDKHTATIVGDH